MDTVPGDPLALLIVACEIGFWVLVAGGLVLRYPLRRRRAGAWVLAGVPLVDVVLVTAALIDLRRGGEVGSVHTLAAYYLGFSVAFGPSLVRWADVRFAHRFANGPAPSKPAKGSREEQVALWREWFRAVGAAVVAGLVLLLLAFAGADGDDRPTLLTAAGPLGIVVVVWFLCGPLTALGRRPAATDRPPSRAR